MPAQHDPWAGSLCGLIQAEAKSLPASLPVNSILQPLGPVEATLTCVSRASRRGFPTTPPRPSCSHPSGWLQFNPGSCGQHRRTLRMPVPRGRGSGRSIRIPCQAFKLVMPTFCQAGLGNGQRADLDISAYPQVKPIPALSSRALSPRSHINSTGSNHHECHHQWTDIATGVSNCSSCDSPGGIQTGRGEERRAFHRAETCAKVRKPGVGWFP